MISILDIFNWYTLLSFIWLYFCLIFSDITEKDGETYFPHPILLPDSRTLPYLFFQLGAILALLFVVLSKVSWLTPETSFTKISVMTLINVVILIVSFLQMFSPTYKRGWLIRLPIFISLSIIQLYFSNVTSWLFLKHLVILGVRIFHTK